MHDDDYCIAHSPRRAIVAPRFQGPGSGRPRRPREIELVQQVAEEFKDQLRRVYADGLTAERGVVVGDGPTAHVEYVPDHGQRLRTAQEIQDRLHGKPARAGEQSDQRVDVNLNLITDHDLREQSAKLRRRLAFTRAIEPGRPYAGNGTGLAAPETP